MMHHALYYCVKILLVSSIILKTILNVPVSLKKSYQVDTWFTNGSLQEPVPVDHASWAVGGLKYDLALNQE